MKTSSENPTTGPFANTAIGGSDAASVPKVLFIAGPHHDDNDCALCSDLAHFAQRPGLPIFVRPAFEFELVMAGFGRDFAKNAADFYVVVKLGPGSVLRKLLISGIDKPIPGRPIGPTVLHGEIESRFEVGVR